MSIIAENYALALSGDAIVAQSTPMGRSAIAVVRGSGKSIFSIFDKALSLGNTLADAEPNHALVVDISIGDFTDRAIATVFHAPKSYTGEDMIEISVHGNPVLVERIIEELIDNGARLAMPGEFTFRAVAAGKMTLIDAEAVALTVDAPTERALRAARQSANLVPKLVNIKKKLYDILLEITAILEFPEDDISTIDTKKWRKGIEESREGIESILHRTCGSRILAEGLTIAVSGEPNVGKSTLFNWIVGAERAIVTPHPGTTRDIIEATVELDGVPVTILDTAGLRDSKHPIEREGIRRAKEAMATADIVIRVIDGSVDESSDKSFPVSLSNNEILVLNKSDIGLCQNARNLMPPGIAVSALMGSGMDKLLDALSGMIKEIPADAVMISLRTENLLARVKNELDDVIDAIAKGFWDVAQVCLDNAENFLGRIFGDDKNPDIYGDVFERFCIGK